MDNDGDLDLVVANGFPNPGVTSTPTRLYENLGDGTFREVGALAGIDDTDQGRQPRAVKPSRSSSLRLFGSVAEMQLR